MATVAETNAADAPPKKKSKTFLIVLILLVVAGGAFGITKYVHSLHHEETDDAQVEANINPVIPKISGYVKEVRVKDNQRVKQGDTLLVLDNRDLHAHLTVVSAARRLTPRHAARPGTRQPRSRRTVRHYQCFAMPYATSLRPLLLHLSQQINRFALPERFRPDLIEPIT